MLQKTKLQNKLLQKTGEDDTHVDVLTDRNSRNMFWKRGLKHWGRQKGQLRDIWAVGAHREWKGRRNQFSFLRTPNKQTEKTGQTGAAATKKRTRQSIFGHAKLSLLLSGDPPKCVQGWIQQCGSKEGGFDCKCLAAGNVSTCDDEIKRGINDFVARGCGEHHEEHHGDEGPPKCVQGWIQQCGSKEEGFDCKCLAAGNVSTCDDEIKSRINDFVARGCGEHHEEHHGDEGPPKCVQGWIQQCGSKEGGFDCKCLAAGDVSTCDDQTKRDINEFVAGGCDKKDGDKTDDKGDDKHDDDKGDKKDGDKKKDGGSKDGEKKNQD